MIIVLFSIFPENLIMIIAFNSIIISDYIFLFIIWCEILNANTCAVQFLDGQVVESFPDYNFIFLCISHRTF